MIFSDNNNYILRIDKIEQKMAELNVRIPSVLHPVTADAGSAEWKKRMSLCLDFFEKNSLFPGKKRSEEGKTIENIREDKGISDSGTGTEEDICALYIASKSEKSLLPVLERFQTILTFRQEPVSSALLAASFYGMEELRMRIPRVEDTLINPFGTGKMAEAVSGTILIADGGPAEAAKAIQLYMMYKDRGIDMEDLSVVRMLGLLGLMAGRPAELASIIETQMSDLSKHADYAGLGGTALFLLASALWIEETIREPERREKLNMTAQNLAAGMPQELAAITAGSFYPARIMPAKSGS